jgi:hypothetical protein
MSMQEGNTDPAPDVSLTGNAAAMFLGEETITGDANLEFIRNFINIYIRYSGWRC